LGQWYVGSQRSALLFAIPVAAVLLVALIQLRDGLTTLAFSLLNPSTALTIFALVGLLGVWRLIAMADAMVSAGRGRTWRRPSTLATFGALALIVVGVHAFGASLAWSAYRAGSEIFVGQAGPDSTTDPASLAPGATPASLPPQPSPLGKDARVTVLLTGVDSSPTRNHALTDTMLVVSVDPTSGHVSMVSFPRDIANFRLTDGRIFSGKLNSLASWADRHPDQFPGGGMVTLSRELGNLLGIPIPYYATIDLEGFARMIDRVGGVTVNVSSAIDDPMYGGWTDGRPIGFRLSKGEHHLDGQEALAYVRSRRTTNDFSRARRQQQLLIALQRKLTEPAMLPNLPGILGDAAGVVHTNVPVDDVQGLVDLASKVDDQHADRIVLTTPYAIRPRDLPANTYFLKLDMAKLRELSVQLFGTDSAYAPADTTPSPGSAGAP
jgi:LCP family protein required for cell wall assembly